MLRLLTLLLLAIPAALLAGAGGASYTINTNARAEAVLDRATAPGGSHDGKSKQQVLQGFANAGMRELEAQQEAQDARLLANKAQVATTGAKTNANAALNAGITPPTIAAIPAQTHNVNQVVAVPITATNVYPDDFSLTFAATGLPPGIHVSTNPVGAPELQGTLTTAGTYTVTVQAWNDGFTDIPGTTTFSWTVNP